MNKIILLIFLLSLVAFQITAKPIEDTVETKYILKEKNILKRAESYHWYTLYFMYSNVEKSKKYNLKAEEIYKKFNNPEGILKCINAHANIAFIENDPQKSYQIFQKGIVFCEKYKGEKWAKVAKFVLYADLTFVLNYFGDYNESLKYLMEAYDYFKIHNQGNAYNGTAMISKLYLQLGKYEESLKFSLIGLKHGKHLYAIKHDLYEPNLILVNTIKIKSLILLGRYSEAELELEKLKKELVKHKVENFHISYYTLMSLLNTHKKKYDLALLNVNKAIELYPKTGNLKHLAENLFIKAETLLNVNRFKESEKVFLELLKKESGVSKADIYKHLSIVKSKQKLYGDAYTYLTKSNKIKDSLAYVEKTNKAIFWGIKYESEKNLKQISDLENKKIKNDLKLNQQRIFIISLMSGLGLLLIIGFVFFRNLSYRKKLTEKENLQLKQHQQLTATESILKGQEEERGRLARDLHDGLGGLLSGLKLNLNTMTGNVILSEQNAQVFQRSLGQLDQAIVEMRRVAHSMMPEALLRFGLVDAIKDFSENISQAGKTKVHFQTIGLDENRLPENIEITLYRIVQELINNVIKHANATDAYIQLSKTDNLITLTVEDNGQGFDINATSKEGIGMKNIKNRVDYLGGNLDIRSEKGKGSSFVIEIHI